MGSLLGRSDIWFCLCVVRTSEVAKLQAGMSQVLRLILEDLFGHGLPETGVLLTSLKGSLRLYFSLSMILQDGSAHKQVFANRQDAGSKPCFICSNIFYLRSGEEEHCKVFKEFIKYDKLHISTDQDVLNSWQRLAAKSKTLSQAEFKMHQQAAGLTYNEHALLSSEKLKECGLLKPISLYCFDYMHGMCSSGLLGDITYLVLESIHNAGFKIWQDLQPWLEVWVLPKAYSCCLGNLFDSKSVGSCRKAHTFKCSASEMLSLYKLLRYYLQVMYLAHNIKAEQCCCFLCWANVLDYLVSIPFIEASPSHLLSLVERALESSVQAGFGDEMKPKQHWSIHYADCLKRWSQLPACWALERKHKTARKYGSNHCRLGTYEQGLLASVTMEHISILVGDADLFKTTCHLIEPRDLPKKLEATLKSMHCFVPGMLCSNSAMLQSGSICKANDVVFLEKLPGATSYIWSCGQAKHFLAAFELQFCLVEVFTFLTQREGTMSSSWTTSNSLQLVPLGKLLQPVAHTFGKDGQVLCLTPAPLACQMWKHWACWQQGQPLQASKLLQGQPGFSFCKLLQQFVWWPLQAFTAFASSSCLACACLCFSLATILLKKTDSHNNAACMAIYIFLQIAFKKNFFLTKRKNTKPNPPQKKSSHLFFSKNAKLFSIFLVNENKFFLVFSTSFQRLVNFINFITPLVIH